ncbi:MAG: DUF58 domain-containing protein [Nocardioides sp.]|nr:DUF58 domain-containing protein [Nocardioides sp.]
MSSVLSRVRRAVGVLTPAGRALLVLGLLGMGVGGWTGLVELRVVGAMCLVLLVLAVPWLLLPTGLAGTLALHPPRTVAGNEVGVRVTLTRDGGVPLWNPLVRIPTIEDTAWVRPTSLRRGQQRSHTLVLPTTRRGVFPIGPAAFLRTDPLGLLRRWREAAPAVDLYVRPVIVGLDALGLGQMRDLEGAATDQISMNDLAFHALREYVPGDDMRHVHWRSSARAGEVLVRQYQDSRRNHVGVVVDLAGAAYGKDPRPGFELAASVAASLVSAAAADGQQITLLAGEERMPGRSGHDVLDALCRIEPVDEPTLTEDLVVAATVASDASILFVVTGGHHGDDDDTAAALWLLPPDTRGVVIRAVPGVEPGVVWAQGREVLTVGALADLPGMMRAVR